MHSKIEGTPSFSRVEIMLSPGEKVTAERGAMQSMAAETDMKAVSNGGFFSALGKKFFGGETFFVNEFTNNTARELKLVIAQEVPGEICKMELHGGEICLQRGAYLAHSGKIKVRTVWAGFASFFGGEGLVKLKVSGTGTLWFGAYGGIITREVTDEIIVDDGFLVAYEPGLKLSITLASGALTSLFGGEGFVSRLKGRGKVYIQTRSVKGLASWLNPKFR